MPWGPIILFILVVTTVAVVTWGGFKGGHWMGLRWWRPLEGFQATAAATAAAAAATAAEAAAAKIEIEGKTFEKGRTDPGFWAFLERKDTPEVADLVTRAMTKVDDNDVDVTFPRYLTLFSVYRNSQGGINRIKSIDARIAELQAPASSSERERQAGIQAVQQAYQKTQEYQTAVWPNFTARYTAARTRELQENPTSSFLQGDSFLTSVQRYWDLGGQYPGTFAGNDRVGAIQDVLGAYMATPAAATALQQWLAGSEAQAARTQAVMTIQAEVNTLTQEKNAILKEAVTQARTALLTNYNGLQNDLATKVYDQARITTWGTDPKTQTCLELRRVKLYLQQLSANTKRQIQDLSGSIGVATGAKDENLARQFELADTCRGNLSQACKDLASQDGAFYGTLAEFDAVNANLFEKDIDIQESLIVVEDILKLVRCDISGATFDVEKDLDLLDVESYRAKLNELSPYYLSPATLAFVTKLLVGSDESMKALQTTNDTIVEMNTTIGNVRDTAVRFFPS